jgi:phage-related minor tail protein
MFENFNKVGSIEVLERKLKELETPANKASYWQKLSDACAKMSADQLNFVSNNDEVTQAKSRMMEAFNLYLFERFKEEFATTEMFAKCCDNYVDKIIDTASNYSESITKTLDENEKLKAKIAELERKLSNAKSNTKGA